VTADSLAGGTTHPQRRSPQCTSVREPCAATAWLDQTFSDLLHRKHYIEKHDLGNVPPVIADFISFYDARVTRLRARIVTLFGVQPTLTEAA
jgi:hypothetical protein